MNEAERRAHSLRTGIPADALERAFAGAEASAPLEIPDRMDVTFKYSYGELSPFFRGLREGRILGTKCRRCGRVTLPPRPRCGRCFAESDWVECGPEGTVVAATTVHFGTSASADRAPYVCAFVRLDGADTALLGNVAGVTAATPGTRVRARFRDVRVGRMDDLEFVPA